jgi:DNA-directed RNA polymerase specialized sigma24 family protein
MSAASDTSLLHRLKTGGDASAAQQVWERYFHRLAGLAREKMLARHRRAADEEDVALSALDSFFRGAALGRFARLDDRDDLWQVLVLLTERKLIDRLRREQARKRGGGKVRGDSVFLHRDEAAAGLDELAGAEPAPELVAAFAEECQRLFDLLDDPELRLVALLKSEGFTNEEIARSLDRVPRSIARKLQTIRRIWEASDG